MEPLFTFPSNHQTDWITLGIALFIALVAGAAWYQLANSSKEKIDQNRRVLGAMLLFFVVIIALGTAAFSVWSIKRTPDVVIYSRYIDTPYGRIPLADIINASIRVEKQTSLVNPEITRKTVKILVIEEKNGKVHALSESNYDINGILNQLRKVVEANQTG